MPACLVQVSLAVINPLIRGMQGILESDIRSKQLRPPVWLGAYITCSENSLNAPLIPGWSRVVAPSGVSGQSNQHYFLVI